MIRSTIAEKARFKRGLSSYSSIGDGESSGSSSSSDDEDSPNKRRHELTHFTKRIFKDSTADLHSLDVDNLKTNYYDMDPEEMDVTNPVYIDLLKIQFFTLGFASGAAIQMFVVSVILMFVSYSHHSGPLLELSHEYYPVFRCMFFIAFFFSLYGGNLFIWRRFKIEYRSVLGVSSAHKYQSVLRGSASVAYIMFSCFMLYVLTITGGLEALHIRESYIKHLWPFLAFALPLFLFFCPYEELTRPCFGATTRGYQQRMGMMQDIGAVMFSPFSKVTFLRTFIADIMCSMPKIFTDLQYTTCIYLTGTFWDSKNEWLLDSSIHSYDTCGAGSTLYTWLLSLLSFAPYYIRLMQSMRCWVDTGETKHLFNAWKYLLSLSVTGIALAHSKFPTVPHLNTLWFVVSAVTTAYCFYWDVVMDWGLGNRDVPYFLLRRELYFQPMTYYTAIVLDLVMRLGWAILISPSQTYLQQHLVLLLGCVELLRRFMWAVFRVEWEWIKVKNKLPAAESSLELAEEGEGWGGKGEVSQSDVIAALTAAGDVDAAITEKSPR